METQLAETKNAYVDGQSFDLVQRMAKALSESDLVPKSYQKNIPNTMIALEMANRMNASPIMVMQNLYVIQGKPSWSSSFIIAAINSCGRFSKQLRFKCEGTGENKSCYAYTNDTDGDLLEGPVVTMAMAKMEGWIDKTGSKWKTMPDLMIRYRAAAFFGRLYCPEILMGMQSEDEVIDVQETEQLCSHGQWSFCNSLLQSSTLPMEKSEPIAKEIEGKLTAKRASEIIEYLQLNQQQTLKEQLGTAIKEDDAADYDFFYSQMMIYGTREELNAYENSIRPEVSESKEFKEALAQRRQELLLNKAVAV